MTQEEIDERLNFLGFDSDEIKILVSTKEIQELMNKHSLAKLPFSFARPNFFNINKKDKK